MMEVRERGRVVMLGDKFWGIQHQSGGSTSEGWGNIKKATLALDVFSGRFLNNPEDMLCEGSHYTDEIKRGHVVEIERITDFHIVYKS